jgi:hypothetical protein
MKLRNLSQDFLVLFLITFFTTLVYFSPFFVSALEGYKPELRFTGDLQILNFPLSIQAGKYFHEWTFEGIDFFTANGSSSAFLRANLPIYYLPQLILQTIFNVSSNALSVKFFLFVMWLSGFIAMIFTALWLNKVLKIGLYLSLLGGALYFSIIGYSYGQMEFFYVFCSFPPLIYCLSVALIKETNFAQKILLSIPFLLILTAGYLPIACMGILFAILGSFIFCRYYGSYSLRYKDFFIVLGIAAFVSSGFLFAILQASEIVPKIPHIPLIESVFFSDFSLQFHNIITIFIVSVSSTPPGEGPHFRLGLPILILLYVVCRNLPYMTTDIRKKNIFIGGMIIFLLSIFLSMGTISGFANVFFYDVPVFGQMHIFARYMPLALFFLIVGLMVGLSEVYPSKMQQDYKLVSACLALTLLVMLIFPQVLTNNSISFPLLSLELLISVLVLFSLQCAGNEKYALILIPILVLFQGGLTYMQENWITLSNTGNTYTDIVNSEPRMSGLINYFYTNSDKTLIKYIDITPEIEKHGGVPLNFPWFIRYNENDPRRISSYMGYEQALSQQIEYAQKFSYYSKYDKNYLMDSGVDYVIYDRKTQEKEAEWLKTITDSRVPEYDIGNGFFAIKVLQEDTKNDPFNNGLFKVVSTDPKFKTTLFKTNWSTKAELNFSTSQPGKISFHLFPRKGWKYYLNEQRIEPSYDESGLAVFSYSPGENKFMAIYSNIPLEIFLWILLLYIIAIIVILVRFSLKKLNLNKL